MRHAREARPAECCGLLLGSATTVAETIRTPNATDDPNRFFIEPQAHIEARREARGRNLEVVGFYHSHPHSPPEPSTTDLTEASYPDHLYLIVSPATDPNSTTVQVWVQADNGGERLRAGQSVHVSIIARTIDGATLVPASAILADDEGATIVKVVDDKNIAHNRPVQVGARDQEMVQVSGVEPGERVIKEGGVGLEDKAQVRIMKPGEKAAGEKEEKEEDEKDTKDTKETKEPKDTNGPKGGPQE